MCRLTSGIIFAAFAFFFSSNLVDAAPAVGAVQVSQLPLEARVTYRLVRSGGPFPFPKDGMVFGNRERELPAKARGFYREYTVQTPGSRDRGARRLVCGGYEVSKPDACYYSDDHYSSFRKIVE
jgi:ribonuclease T1